MTDRTAWTGCDFAPGMEMNGSRLGQRNLAAIERIVSAKYQRGAALNRQHPYVEVLFSDITESGEALDLSGLMRKPLPPAFHRLN